MSPIYISQLLSLWHHSHSHYDVYGAGGARSPCSDYDVILIVTSFATELATPTITDVHMDTLPHLIYKDVRKMVVVVVGAGAAVAASPVQSSIVLVVCVYLQWSSTAFSTVVYRSWHGPAVSRPWRQSTVATYRTTPSHVLRHVLKPALVWFIKLQFFRKMWHICHNDGDLICAHTCVSNVLNH